MSDIIDVDYDWRCKFPGSKPQPGVVFRSREAPKHDLENWGWCDCPALAQIAQVTINIRAGGSPDIMREESSICVNVRRSWHFPFCLRGDCEKTTGGEASLFFPFIKTFHALAHSSKKVNPVHKTIIPELENRI